MFVVARVRDAEVTLGGEVKKGFVALVESDDVIGGNAPLPIIGRDVVCVGDVLGFVVLVAFDVEG